MLLVDNWWTLVDNWWTRDQQKSRAGESPTRLERYNNLSRHVSKYQLRLSRISGRKDKPSGHLIWVLDSLVHWI